LVDWKTKLPNLLHLFLGQSSIPTRSVVSISEDWKYAILFSSEWNNSGVTLKLDVHEIKSLIPFETEYVDSLPSNIIPQFVGDNYQIVYRDESDDVWTSDALNPAQRKLLFDCREIVQRCPPIGNFEINYRDSLIFLEDSIGLNLYKFDSIGQVSQMQEFGAVYMSFFSRDLNKCFLVYDGENKQKAVVEYDIKKKTMTKLFEFDGFIFSIVSKGEDYPIYFTAHRVSFGPINLLRFDRGTGAIDSVTSFSSQPSVGTVHFHGDSILYEIKGVSIIGNRSEFANLYVKRLLDISSDLHTNSPN